MFFSISPPRAIVWLSWGFSTLSTLQAYSFGAGGCDGGVPAVGPPHFPPYVTSVTNGSLATGAITVLLDGQPLTPGVPASFLIGQSHNVTLKRGNSYKGILIRLGGAGTNALNPLPNDSLYSTNFYCASVSASGVTHTSNVEKNESVAVLKVSTAASSLPLDVTVVIVNEQTSEFYYSGFILNAVASINAAPTAAPVKPTAKPITPTVKPVTPTIKPVTPTIKPVVTPTIKPAPVAPTKAPTTNGTTIKIPPGYCFSELSTVEVADKGIISIKDLKIGDFVRSADGKMTQVYSFGHYHPNVKAKYVQIHAKGLAKTLEISNDHLLFVNGKAVPASTVSIGDELTTNGRPGRAVVTAIKSMTRSGAYAPFTMSGTIMINGVAASTYVTLQEDSSVLLMSTSSFRTVSLFSYQWLAHVFQSPHRLFCRMRMDICQMDTYTDDGISLWVKGPLTISQWLIQQNGIVMAAMLIPALTLGLVVCAVEWIWCWGLVTIFLAIIGWRLVTLRNKNKLLKAV